ncbi:MAG: UbiD family decarboxylase [Planctomycetaceae bacterium]|nr:UbiD family decarboxylase [Planctomycetaceae bacterium]
MPFKTLRSCVYDLLRTGQMVRIDEPVDSYLEIAAIGRQVFRRHGPALYFANVYDSSSGQNVPCKFPMVSNLYGTMSRIEYIFRGAIEPLKKVMSLGADPLAEMAESLQNAGRWWSFPSLLKTAYYARPKKVRSAPVLKNVTTLNQLPQFVSWPGDGGPFITLPLVYTENPLKPGVMNSNLGMYRVQIGGNRYEKNTEAGLHYQIHRGIAAHHAAALELKKPLPVSVFVGGAPAMTLAAIMPLPENVSELTFAGMLGRHRIPMVQPTAGNLPIYAEADFCISGYLDADRILPEGPFGDHLGYYSLEHEFPVLRVERVYHRDGAIWPFTVVGRPPQEDSMFGEFIHKLTGPLVPKKIPGVHSIRAVDEAGVHPLLLAIGSERYHPYSKIREKAELHTLAHALLGFGQLSLAKYLFLTAQEDDPTLSVDQTERFFEHVLRRVDWASDLHFTTRTNMDTLDYTGGTLHRGSKVAICVAGPPIRELPDKLDESYNESLNKAFSLGLGKPKMILPGVLLLFGVAEKEKLARMYNISDPINRIPWIVLVDEAAKMESFRDFLWTTFTKSDPANDLDGIGAFTDRKHWGCHGSLILDARSKPHHAPELEENAEVEERAAKIVQIIFESVRSGKTGRAGLGVCQ